MIERGQGTRAAVPDRIGASWQAELLRLLILRGEATTHGDHIIGKRSGEKRQ